MSRFFLDHQRTHAGGRHRPHLNVVVEIDDLAGAEVAGSSTGRGWTGSTVSRLLCDSALHRVEMPGRSAVIDYGTSTLTIPAPLWNALGHS